MTLGILVVLVEVLSMTLDIVSTRASLHLNDTYVVIGTFDYISTLNIFLGIAITLIASKLPPAAMRP